MLPMWDLAVIMMETRCRWAVWIDPVMTLLGQLPQRHKHNEKTVHIPKDGCPDMH